MNEEACMFIGAPAEEDCPFRGAADILNQPPEFYEIDVEMHDDDID